MIGVSISYQSKAATTASQNCDFIYYPSGCFDFIDDCGNDVSACWSCNFDCSNQQIVSAITRFISGYGCGNYTEQEYPY